MGDDDLALDSNRPGQLDRVLLRDPLAQLDDAVGGAVLHDPRAVLAEQSIGLSAQVGEREAVGRGQAAGEREHVAHLGHLQQVADGGGTQAGGAGGEGVRHGSSRESWGRVHGSCRGRRRLLGP
jgi:hypothetical protein